MLNPPTFVILRQKVSTHLGWVNWVCHRPPPSAHDGSILHHSSKRCGPYTMMISYKFWVSVKARWQFQSHQGWHTYSCVRCFTELWQFAAVTAERRRWQRRGGDYERCWSCQVKKEIIFRIKGWSWVRSRLTLLSPYFPTDWDGLSQHFCNKRK